MANTAKLWTHTSAGFQPDLGAGESLHSAVLVQTMPAGYALRRTRFQHKSINTVSATGTGPLSWDASFYALQDFSLGVTVLSSVFGPSDVNNPADSSPGGYWVFNEAWLPETDILTDASGQFQQIVHWNAPGSTTVESFAQTALGSDTEQSVFLAWAYDDLDGFWSVNGDTYAVDMLSNGYLSMLWEYPVS